MKAQKAWMVHMLVNDGTDEPVGMGFIMPVDEMPDEAEIAMALHAMDPNFTMQKLTKLERSVPVIMSNKES